MRTAYLIRHQHQGFIHQHVFESPPSDEQIVAVLGEISRRHDGPFRVYDSAREGAIVDGLEPPVPGSWYRIEEIAIYAEGELPTIPPDPNATDGMSAPQVSAVGTVTPPETMTITV